MLEHTLPRLHVSFATGQALYALSLAGNRDEKEKVAMERAIEFLVTTQENNGSWRVIIDELLIDRITGP